MHTLCYNVCMIAYEDMKIDLVYTWVDNNDENWQKKKLQFLDPKQTYNKDAVDVCRFINNDELKYSLRSVQENIPWINNIYIITDNQKPKWLNTENPKIKIIDHKEIIPEDKLPIFNSVAIENTIPYIKELSEYFIYANDDMYFWNKVDKSFFFKGDKPIVRIDKKINKHKNYTHLYGHMIYRAYKLAYDKLGIDIPYFPHHNADSYRKSIWLKCIQTFKKEYELTLSNRFRHFSDLERMIVSYFSVYRKDAVLEDVSLNLFDKLFKTKEIQSEYIDAKNSMYAKIKKSKTKLVCINDSRKTTDETRKKIKLMLEEKFPNKSEFEI